MSDLSLKATRGMLWSLTEYFGLQAVQLVISVVLARLLMPEQFGLIGMLVLFMAIAQTLLNSGFGLALIQKKDADHVDACSVFYFNLVVGVILTVALIAIAPLIAQFYREPSLIPLTRFLSLNILINAFVLVPSALLTKSMDFKVQLKISMLSVVISGAVGIALAVRGWGVWSLAIQSVLATLIRAVFLWWLSHWRPSLIFSRRALAVMFSFGSRMMLSGLLDTFFMNIYQPLIGRFYSPADVGFYTRAQTLQAPAVQPAGAALGRVLMPALATIQDEPERVNGAVRKITAIALFFHFPLTIGLIVVAEPLITLLLTDRWAPSIPYFQLFCLVGLLYPLHIINLAVLQALGRSDLFFRLEVIKKILILLALAVTFRGGITALLWGQVMVWTVAYFLNAYYTGGLIGYPTTRQMADGTPYLFASLLMGGAMVAFGGVITPNWLKLIAQVSTGVLVYLGFNYLMDKTVLLEMARLTRQTFQLRSQPG